jgi:hypothetical protein
MLVRSLILIGQLLMISPFHAQGNPYCAQYSDGTSTVWTIPANEPWTLCLRNKIKG